jgi:hypothetical protein
MDMLSENAPTFSIIPSTASVLLANLPGILANSSSRSLWCSASSSSISSSQSAPLVLTLRPPRPRPPDGPLPYCCAFHLYMCFRNRGLQRSNLDKVRPKLVSRLVERRGEVLSRHAITSKRVAVSYTHCCRVEGTNDMSSERIEENVCLSRFDGRSNTIVWLVLSERSGRNRCARHRASVVDFGESFVVCGSPRAKGIERLTGRGLRSEFVRECGLRTVSHRRGFGMVFRKPRSKHLESLVYD